MTITRSHKRIVAGILALALVTAGMSANTSGVLPLFGTAVYAEMTDISGTTEQSYQNDYVGYRVGGSEFVTQCSFNVNGMLNGSAIPSTYNNAGYVTYVKVGDGVQTLIPNAGGGFVYGKVYVVDGVQVRITAEIPEGEKTVHIKYELCNTTADNVTVKLGSGGDTQIGDNDEAKVEFLPGGKGISMLDDDESSDTYGAQLMLLPGDGQFDTLWYGKYGEYYSHTNIFSSREDTSALTRTDSAISWSWTIELPAGETVEKTAKIGIFKHDHNFEYSVSGATVTAHCTAEECTLESDPVLTVTAPEKTAYNDGRSEAAVLDGLADFNSGTRQSISANDIVYSGTLSDGTAYPESSTPPTSAGEYTASVTVGGKTASVSYTISKIDPPYGIPVGLTATYGDTLSAVSLDEGWTWADAAQPVGDVGIKSFAGIYTPADKVNFNTVDEDIPVNVVKAEPAFTAPAAREGLVYTGNAQELVTAGTTEDGKIVYSTDGTEFSEAIAAGTKAGTYTVYWKVQGDANHLDSAVDTVSVSIAPSDPAGAPAAREGLEYTGNAQELVTAGDVDGGTMLYSTDGSEYSETVPTAVDAGNYTVWYKIDGDEDHTDTDPQEMNISIAKASQTAPVVGSSDETVSGLNDGIISGLDESMQISTTGAEEDFTAVSGDQLTELAPGIYYVRYAENANYTASPAAAVTIKAGRLVTISFETDGGSEIADVIGSYGTDVTAPADPEKTGYAFGGWDTEIPATIPAEDMTITAIWNINSYTITFDTAEGSEIAPMTVEYGMTVSAPEAPVKDGYNFVRWDPELPGTMPAEDITVKAVWEKIPEPKPEPEPEPEPEVIPDQTKVSTYSYSPSYGPSSLTSVDNSTRTETIKIESNEENKNIYAKSAGENRIKLWWDSIDGANEYAVYFVNGGRLHKLGDTKKTEYYVRNVKPGRSYTFIVKHITKDGISKNSRSYKITVDPEADKPVVTASVKDKKIILRWNKVDNAEMYAVYRVHADGTLERIGKTTKTSVIIEPGSDDKGYAVKALVNGKWTKVTQSDIVTIAE
ncbi:MAG: InlB B-repeat-containing protein [Oscillospiraceae bacterium]|nr:InlB B-repeat-containing protein [Oscillospiraceae bacterium]